MGEQIQNTRSIWTQGNGMKSPKVFRESDYKLKLRITLFFLFLFISFFLKTQKKLIKYDIHV